MVRQEVLQTFGGGHLGSKAVVAVTRFPVKGLAEDAVYTFDWTVAREANTLNHGLHEYPAKFIPRMPAWAFEYARLQVGDTVLDPFCGCGTTLVEARIKGIDSYGLDISPLARMITKVKTTPLLGGSEVELHQAAQSLFTELARVDPTELDEEAGDVNLHYNWRFWFSKETMVTLVAFKRAIRAWKWHEETDLLRDLFLACLSATVKRVSYLDEGQIKVKRDHSKFAGKAPPVFKAFCNVVEAAIPGMAQFSQHAMAYPDAIALVAGEDARSIPLDDESMDLIVTSPPYINAIDYTMAHKYSLFLLDLVKPGDFKAHCLQYIGPTERAVRKGLYQTAHAMEVPSGCHDASIHAEIDAYIQRIAQSNGRTAVDLNRAYIVWSYFTDMQRFLRGALRVLRPHHRCIIVLGDNRIRGIRVPTHELVRRLAISNGFEHEVKFYHRIRGRKLGLTRNVTAGKIEDEMVMVLRKPASA